MDDSEKSGREPTLELLPTRVVAGRYNLGAELGAGGMGRVFEAEHGALGVPVAVKLLGDDFRSPTFTARFEREAKLLARVRHENVVAVMDFGVDDELGPFLVMELLRGETLAAQLARTPRLDVRRAVTIACEMLHGLSALHELGIVHRDLKPANVFLEQRGQRLRTKLIDFGIARDRMASDAVTQDGGVVGTPLYMAPEQLEGDAGVDPRTDIYGAGLVLYRMLTGELPFRDELSKQHIGLRLEQPPRDPRILVPELEPELARIVLCALARNKSTRFESAEAFDAALRERVPSAETATASSNTKPTKPSTKVGRPLRAKGDHASTALPASVPADAAHATSRTTSSGPSSSQPAGMTHPIRGGTPVPRPASSRNATLGGSILAVIAFVGAGYGLFQQSRAADASDEAANGVPANGIAANVTPLHYGVVRYLPTEEVEGTHRRLVEYLSQGIDHPIELRVVEDYTNLGEALASGALDLAVLSANAYVVARDSHPELELVATAVGVAGPFYEGYIVVNAASDIDTLEGLRGHSFCYVSTTSSSGYVYPRALLRQAGVDPDEAFTTTRLTGDHLASLRALHAGACDGAAVFGSILFRAGEFDLSPSMFRVLARTERIPYDAYVLGPRLSEAQRDSLRRALLALEPGSELAQRTFSDPHIDLRGLREASDAQFDEVRALRSFVESD